ncbi:MULTISPECIES: GreA/GreB family elongation factor [unclassified Olleya]|jgi:regulator of nucleoside diphosphate kinase|uniref:GreA/GreB family elongation factor n=1 Tax=unclassified Olleya TaxID=2615019 RepID=UPI0011A225F0|nr:MULTISPECIES: GreA/GreB family elongation factor [unclassified Olleya]TVZ46173.1 regulator of nucleoside diphosphate kinase [Olleya sp. Hel_I_94]|tara:strand:- start:2143 stop:2562 length:420 start_codon:yes stop_codon:yes gene_type:complete
MKYGSLILEKKEYVYLKRILNISGYGDDTSVTKSLVKLSEELKTAQIVNDDQVPEDIVRFNSIVTIASDNGWEKELQVVIPMDKNVALNKVSVLAPMGAALLGYSKNDTIDWDFPGGAQKIKIIDVQKQENLKGVDINI